MSNYGYPVRIAVWAEILGQACLDGAVQGRRRWMVGDGYRGCTGVSGNDGGKSGA
jgi:hypothetical protein